MAKITNTTDDLYYLGDVEIGPHSSVEVPDAVVTKAKQAKAITMLFASGSLALGETAAKREEKLKANPPYLGPPAAVHYKQATDTTHGFIPRATAGAGRSTKKPTKRHWAQPKEK
jgi:hypothetical protein